MVAINKCGQTYTNVLRWRHKSANATRRFLAERFVSSMTSETGKRRLKPLLGVRSHCAPNKNANPKRAAQNAGGSFAQLNNSRGIIQKCPPTCRIQNLTTPDYPRLNSRSIMAQLLGELCCVYLAN